jgi:tagatose-1,6-bisphosphate aldolase non-catalytic subunit AgaZ/GatZ
MLLFTTEANALFQYEVRYLSEDEREEHCSRQFQVKSIAYVSLSMVKRYIKRDEWSIYCIYPAYITKEVVDAYIKQNESYMIDIDVIPRHLITQDIANKYWELEEENKSSYGNLSVESIPREFITQRMADSYSLERLGKLVYIPEHLITEDIINNYIKKAYDWDLDQIPIHLITKNIVNMYTKKKNWDINQIPDHLITDEIRNSCQQLKNQ